MNKMITPRNSWDRRFVAAWLIVFAGDKFQHIRHDQALTGYRMLEVGGRAKGLKAYAEHLQECFFPGWIYKEGGR